tara:strand:- start:10135 stop:10587 length:453 start_codon:yes stop_codon:yes gene_type:complete
MEKGLIFSIDAVIAASILLLSLTLIFISFNYFAQNQIQNTKESNKELFALTLSESIVKNRNEKEPWKGAAYFNSEKQRVEQNVIDASLLKKIPETDFGDYWLSGIYERNTQGVKYFFNKQKNNCLVVERFVVMKDFLEQKTILGLVICEE